MNITEVEAALKASLPKTIRDGCVECHGYKTADGRQPGCCNCNGTIADVEKLLDKNMRKLKQSVEAKRDEIDKTRDRRICRNRTDKDEVMVFQEDVLKLIDEIIGISEGRKDSRQSQQHDNDGGTMLPSRTSRKLSEDEKKYPSCHVVVGEYCTKHGVRHKVKS